MTLLEFVIERTYGSPAYRSGDRATWHCPRHDDTNPSFSTRPPRPGFKDRFQCFSCGWWGDEYDILREFYPGERFPELRVRLNALRIDWEQEVQAEWQSSSYRGRGQTGNPALAWADLRQAFHDNETPEAFALQVAKEFRRVAQANDCTVEEVVDYWDAMIDWEIQSDLDHYAQCDDPECDASMCRAERGLPPLTEDERETLRARHARKRHARNRQTDPPAKAPRRTRTKRVRNGQS